MTFHSSKYIHFVWAFLGCILTLLGVRIGMLLQRLHRDVYSDKLTHVGSRDLCYLTLDYLINREKRADLRNFSIGLIDVDNFKNVNDCYGHQIGDVVLSSIGELLIQSVRDQDTIARWGGEEFAVILPQTNSKEAWKVLERIREQIANFDFGKSINSQKVTVSVGYVTFSEIPQNINSDIDMKELLINLADKALFKAKESKNCTAFYNYEYMN